MKKLRCLFLLLALPGCTSTPIADDTVPKISVTQFRSISVQVDAADPTLKTFAKVIQKNLFEAIFDKREDPRWFQNVYGRSSDRRTGEMVLVAQVGEFSKTVKGVRPTLTMHATLIDEAKKSPVGKFTIVSKLDKDPNAEDFIPNAVKVTVEGFIDYLDKKL